MFHYEVIHTIVYSTSHLIDIWVVSNPLLLKVLQQYAFVFLYFRLCSSEVNFFLHKDYTAFYLRQCMGIPIPESEKAPVVSVVLTSAHPPDLPWEGQRAPNAGSFHD